MRDFDQAIGQLHRQWDPTAAREIIRELVTAIWQAGGPDDQMRRWAASLGKLMSDRLTVASAAQGCPAEQFALLNLCYTLEQGLGNRDEALDLAQRAEALSQVEGSQAATRAAPLERVRAVFQLAKALLYVDRNADAVRWTQQGLQLGDQLEAAPVALSAVELNDLRRLLADQESRQVNRMATLGGMDAEVDRAVASVMARWEKLAALGADPAFMAGGMGMLVEARVFQGRWEEAIRLAHKALAAVGYPARKDPAITYSLCFGALALCRAALGGGAAAQGDRETALIWTADAASLSKEAGNHECVLESRAIHAVALAGLGREGSFDESLREIDQVVEETAALKMGEMTRWVVGLRGWIRMNAHVPTPVALPEELLEAYHYLADRGYRVQAVDVLYAASCALRLVGRGGQEELAEAMRQFERFGMTWHLQLARRWALIG